MANPLDCQSRDRRFDAGRPRLYVASHRHDVFVSLTDAEYAEAVTHGRQIYALSQGRGWTDHHNFTRNGVDGERIQILGSIAERAVSKACGIEWTRWVNTFKAPDLHFNIEVRLIGRENYGLRVYPRDDDSRRVVGVVIERGMERKPYRIPGWINALHGKRPEWLIDPLNQGHPVYAVPQSRLHSLDVLMQLIG